MPISSAVRATEVLLALSMLLQTLEYLRMRQALTVQGLWAWPVQRADIPTGPVQKLLDLLFADRAMQGHLLLRLPVLLLLAWHGSDLALAGLLFASHVLMLIRWRGAFNGGSDFMTLVVLTGVLLAQLVQMGGDPHLAWRAGLWYICLQSITSYFMSGWVKLMQPEWRNGHAMTIFLNAAIYGPLSASSFLRRPWLARLGAWAFIGWECAAPLALLHPLVALVFCTIALLFHFLVFWFFGLNRFFWAWLATFPAILACSAQRVFW